MNRKQKVLAAIGAITLAALIHPNSRNCIQFVLCIGWTMLQEIGDALLAKFKSTD